MAEACLELLKEAEVTSAVVLARMTVEKLSLPEKTPCGRVETLRAACECAQELKQQADKEREEGEFAPNGWPFSCLSLVWCVGISQAGTDKLAAAFERAMALQRAAVVPVAPIVMWPRVVLGVKDHVHRSACPFARHLFRLVHTDVDFEV